MPARDINEPSPIYLPPCSRQDEEECRVDACNRRIALVAAERRWLTMKKLFFHDKGVTPTHHGAPRLCRDNIDRCIREVLKCDSHILGSNSVLQTQQFSCIVPLPVYTVVEP